MSPKRQRLWIVVVGMTSASVGVALMLQSFQQNIVYFFTPSQLEQQSLKLNQTFRLGGLVEQGSITSTGKQSIRFTVTDLMATTKVTYTGLLPALFREGQGVVAQGTLNAKNIFEAKTILAKHDENYMPKEVVDALKKSGQWKHVSPKKETP